MGDAMGGIGLEFMEKTRYRYLGPSDQQQGRPQPPLEAVLGDGSRTPLPTPADLPTPAVGLREAIEVRRSLREYADRPLGIDQLALLLWSTQGVREVLKDRATFRTVPSAGARHPFETVVLANRVDELELGLYQYTALDHALISLASPTDLTGRIEAACHGQQIVGASAATFIWIADAVRTTWRYGERGFRYVHLDAGHVCQNLYLAAEAIGAGACAIGAFDDDALHEILGLDDPHRFVVYLATVGLRNVEA